MFSEAFSLKQVYVEPRAYYKQEIKNDKERDDNFRPRYRKEYEKIVVELETYLDSWLEKANKDDAIKIISGDPGAGKSSFTKMFAAKIAEKQAIPVLFIPLHHFDPTGDLVEAIARFVRDHEYLYDNPLDGKFKESRLLIIFNGLDELSMQGKLGAEVARSFINEVQKTVSRINYHQLHLQVIISGRPIVISSNRDELRKSKQVLHILPYFIPESLRNDYQDEQNLLAEDRRNLWWQKYGEVTGHNYQKMPDELNLNNLLEITIQPLLNYLVALSYVRSQNPDIDQENKIVFSPETNLNTIYQDLLKSVYDRGWDTKQHPTLKGIIYPNFVRILEEIALAAWHGNGRTTTVREIEAHCENSGLKKLLEKFTKGAEIGVTNLLTSFYFRQSGYNSDGNQTFEFTHKSFGEYLTARRIVRELANIHEELQRREQEFDKGWDEKQALIRWITICGMSAIDEYLFEFIRNEISLRDKEDVKQWQKTLSHLIGYMLCQGMPIEQINPRPSYKEECRQSKNAEEALLMILNACAKYTKELSSISWNSKYAFGNWLRRLQVWFETEEYIPINQYLGWLNLKNISFAELNFTGANFEHTNFQNISFWCSKLENVDFSKSSFHKVRFYNANLQGAYFSEVNLEEISFFEANLNNASFEKANLKRADLRQCSLIYTNFKKADLVQASLREGYLIQTFLDDANLEGAFLEGAYLINTNLNKSNIKNIHIHETIMDARVYKQIESKLDEVFGKPKFIQD